MGAAYGFHRAAGCVRVVRFACGVQGGPVAGERGLGATGLRVQIAQVQQGRGLLPMQPAPLGDVQDEAVDAVQVGGRRLGAEVRRHGSDQLGHQPAGEGVQLPVGHGQADGGQQGGPAHAQPLGGRPRGGEAQRGRRLLQLLPGLRAVRLGDRPARLQQPYGPLQHAGAGQLQLGRAFLALGAGAQQRVQTAGDVVLGQRGVHRAQQTEGDELVQGAAGGVHRAAGQGRGGVRVDQAGRGETQQSQYPGGRAGQLVVDEPEDAGEGVAVTVVGVRAHPLGEVGDGRLGPGDEPAAGQGECGRMALAGLGQALGGARVDSDADGAGETGEEFHRRLGVEAPQGAGADVCDAGERAARDGDHQAVRGVRQQGVDLLGTGGVVQQEQDAPLGETHAQRCGQVVLAGSRRCLHLQCGEQLAGSALERYRGAVGLAEPGPQHSVGVTAGDLPHQLPGEGTAAGAGAARDEEHARAGCLAAGEGVQTRALDVGAQFLQLPCAAQEIILHG